MAIVFLAALCIVASRITLPSESAPSYRQESEECTSPECQEAGILKNATNESHERPVLQSALFFQGCIDEEARETQGLHPLKNLLSSLGGWPMANPDWTSDGYHWQTQIANIRRILGIRPID
uniref:U6-Hexatoxin-Hc1g_1 n=1 Tax=Hadronyche cerberea TaxID=1107879 RepID=A0A4Q8KBJ8_HADCE